MPRRPAGRPRRCVPGECDRRLAVARIEVVADAEPRRVGAQRAVVARIERGQRGAADQRRQRAIGAVVSIEPVPRLEQPGARPFAPGAQDRFERRFGPGGVQPQRLGRLVDRRSVQSPALGAAGHQRAVRASRAVVAIDAAPHGRARQEQRAPPPNGVEICPARTLLTQTKPACSACCAACATRMSRVQIAAAWP